MTDRPDAPRRCDGAGAPFGCHGAVHLVRGANLCDSHERFYAGLTDTPRLTDEDLAALPREVETYLDYAYSGDSKRPRFQSEDVVLRAVPSVVSELREARALIAALKAEGCPWREAEDGTPICDYCDGPVLNRVGEEPRFAHRPMDDGEPCLWERIAAL